MSTSRVINRWLNRVYKSIAILLVLFAVLISALRLFLPYAHNYKEQVQSLINDANNSHIVIGELSMNWEKLGPSITVKQVNLLETQSTDIFIDKIQLHLDFWQSLLKGRIITQDVTLDGVQVFIKDISHSVVKNDKEDPLIDRIVDIFLDRINRFSLLNSQVVFQTNKTEKTLLINQLDWLNDGDRHRGKGYVIVDGLTSDNIKVMLDLHGDEINELDGQVYLQANQLNITPWLDTVFAIDNKDTHSSINFDGWLTVKEGFPTELQVALGNNEISWTNNNIHQFFSVNQGNVLTRITQEKGSKVINTFDILSSPLTFITDQNTWEPTRLHFSKTSNTVNGYISHLSVQGLKDIVPLFLNDLKITQLLEKTAPVGVIENLFVQMSPNKKVAIANIKGVTTYPYGGIPGVSNIEGELIFKNSALKLMLNAKEGVLDFAEHFVKPIPYNELSTDLRFNFDKDSWYLSSDNTVLSSDELTLTTAIAIGKKKGDDIKMSLLSRIENVNAEFLNHYFPHLLMSDNLVSYLNAAIVSGRVDQAQVVFNGPLNKFPFNDNEGFFSVDAELSDAEFKFDPRWSAINNFNANLNFTNNSMLITARGGDLEGIDVKGVTARINDLSHNQILEVNADFSKTKPQFISHLMNNSPLKNTVGNTLNRLVLTEPLSGDFSLNLPLNDLEKVVAKGSIEFENNNINLQNPNMLFTQVNGRLTYNNDHIVTNNLTLLWRDMPLKLIINASDKSMFYNTSIDFDANWESEYWLKELPEKLKPYGSGNIAWKGLLSLNMYHEGGFTYDFDINSTLENTTFNLPIPYKKSAGEAVPMKAHITGKNYNTTINASVGEQLQFYGLLNHKEVSFAKAHLVLGSEDMLLPTKGFHITTKLAQANVEEWQPLIFNIIESMNSVNDDTSTKLVQHNVKPNHIALFETPERIRGEIDSLYYGDYALTDTLFNLENSNQAWLLDINSKEIRSQFKLYNNLLEEGIEVDADFIHLIKTSEQNRELDDRKLENSKLDVSELAKNTKDEILTLLEQSERNLFNQKIYTQLPPIVVNCVSCKLGDIDLGKVSFVLERNTENHIVLNKFEASRDKFTMKLNGLWVQENNENMTNVEGSIDIKELDQETEKLGYAPTIKDSGLASDFVFNWRASPYDFSVAQLNGHFKANLDDGYLTEVPDQARVFSVLSLQSLVRKLSFDFRDIFADGMFYSSINGDFQLKKGIMYTDNMFMKGAAGDLDVKGNTDLDKETLDIRMSYKPNVTSSLPALAWIATLNPVAFLAGLALEEVITSKVYYEMNFELTGTMSTPIFKDVNRKTRNISVGKTTPPRIINDVIIEPESEKKINDPKLIESLKKSKVDG